MLQKVYNVFNPLVFTILSTVNWKDIDLRMGLRIRLRVV